MVSSQLLDYIRQQLAAGISKEEIIKSLVANNWQVADINEAFAAFPSPQLTPPPVVQAPTQNFAQPVVSSHKGIWAVAVVFLLLIGAGGAFAAYQYGLFTSPVATTATPPVTTTTASPTPNFARGNDDAIQSYLSIIQTLYYEAAGNSNSYTGVCINPVIVKALTSAQTANGGTAPICNTSATAYAVSSPLLSGDYWCVDSTGFAGKNTTALGTKTTCPIPCTAQSPAPGCVTAPTVKTTPAPTVFINASAGQYSLLSLNAINADNCSVPNVNLKQSSSDRTYWSANIHPTQTTTYTATCTGTGGSTSKSVTVTVPVP